jgi:Ubiquitin-conjugating enzyme
MLAVIAVTQVKFNTRIYHPNIKTDTGDICTDVLNDNWGPTLNVRYVLNALKQVSSKRTAFNNVRPVLYAVVYAAGWVPQKTCSYLSSS